MILIPGKRSAIAKAIKHDYMTNVRNTNRAGGSRWGQRRSMVREVSI